MATLDAVRTARLALGLAIVAVGAVGPTLPAGANDVESYVAGVAQCAVWALTDPARHDEHCIDTALSGPYASIQSTGDAVSIR